VGTAHKIPQVEGAARHGEASIGYSPDDCCQHILFTPHQRAGNIFFKFKCGLL